jgi:hypothetical protein
MMRKSLQLSFALGALAAIGVFVPSAKAVIINGGFESTPDFSGWSTIGNTSLQQSDFKPPAEGVNQALLSNNPQPVLGSSGAVTDIPMLDAFFNLGAGALEARGAQSGSGVKQTFFATAGDTVTFKYDFATNESTTPSRNSQDEGFFTLVTPAGGAATLVGLATPSSPAEAGTPVLQGINSYFNTETGYLTGSIPISSTGTYTLAFGVSNVGNTTNSSGLLIDAVSGATGNGSTVPLPAGVYLMPLGLLAAGVFAHKLRRTVES